MEIPTANSMGILTKITKKKTIEISIEFQLDFNWISIGFQLDFNWILTGSIEFQLDFQWISN